MCPWQRSEEQSRGAAHKGPAPPLSCSCWRAVRCLLCLSGVHGQGSRSGFIRHGTEMMRSYSVRMGIPCPWERGCQTERRHWCMAPEAPVHEIAGGVQEQLPSGGPILHGTLSRTRTAVSVLHDHVAVNLAVGNAGRDLRYVPHPGQRGCELVRCLHTPLMPMAPGRSGRHPGAGDRRG